MTLADISHGVPFKFREEYAQVYVKCPHERKTRWLHVIELTGELAGRPLRCFRGETIGWIAEEPLTREFFDLSQVTDSP